MQSSGVTVLNAIDTSVRAEVVDKYTVICLLSERILTLEKSFLDRIQVRTVWREESNKSPQLHESSLLFYVHGGCWHCP